MSRRLRALALAALIALPFTAPLHAMGGSATIAYWRARYDSADGNKSITSSIYIQNVTTQDIQVKLNLYDGIARQIGDPGFAAKVVAYGGTSCNTANNVCTLPAGYAMSWVVTHNNVNMDAAGRGTIEWNYTGSNEPANALVADGQVIYYRTASDGHIVKMTITRDQPF